MKVVDPKTTVTHQYASRNLRYEFCPIPEAYQVVEQTCHSDKKQSNNGKHNQFGMCGEIQCKLEAAPISNIYTHYIGTTFILSSQYHLIAIFLGMNLSYYILKSAIYAIVNSVFFERKKNVQWQKTLLFLISMEGVMIFPAVMVRSYFDIPIQSITIYSLIVVVFVKLLTFYKSYAIFFRQIHPFFQIILYFCALEAVPMAAFWGAVAITGNYLNINF